MSDALTPESPATDPAAVSVETTVPGDEAAVEGGSAGGEGDPKVVPAERFNGLMSKLHQVQQEAEQREQALQAELETLRADSNKETQPVADDTEALRAELAETRKAVRELALDRARAQVLDEFPAAAPLADLIVGDSVEELREVASTIAERLSGFQPAPTPEGEPETPAAPEAEAEVSAETPPAPEPPVVGGAVSVSGDSSFAERKAAALEAGDLQALMDIKFEEQSQGQVA